MLRPGGRLVASSYFESNLEELWALIEGLGPREPLSFSQTNGAELLLRHFATRRATRPRGDAHLSRHGVDPHVRRVDDRPCASRAADAGGRRAVPRDDAARDLRRGEGRMIRPAELIERKRDGEELGGGGAGRARARVRARRRPGLPARRVLHGRLLPGPVERRDVRAHRRDGAQRRHDRSRRRARPARRRQALDRRRRRQDDARRRPDRRGVRRSVREDERPRSRAHRRHARQARVDSRASASS